MKTNTKCNTTEVCKFRKSKGYGQLDIANEIGCCMRTVNRIEYGYIDTIQYGVIKAYCDVLGLTTEDLERMIRGEE